MLVTESGIVTLVNLIQLENALRPMLVILPGITTEVKYFFMFLGIVFSFISGLLRILIVEISNVSISIGRIFSIGIIIELEAGKVHFIEL